MATTDENGGYIQNLRHFIQSEFRDEIREKSSIVIDCLVCKLKPSPNCPVCFPKKPEDRIYAKTKHLQRYNSASHLHTIGKCNASQFVNLAGEVITEETINCTKQMKQLKKLQECVIELREVIHKLEMEKKEALEALNQMTFVCNNMRNRQVSLDNESVLQKEELKSRDYRMADLEKLLQERDNEIHLLRVQCNNSETCRAHVTKELSKLKLQLNRQSEQLQLFSLPTYANTVSTTTTPNKSGNYSRFNNATSKNQVNNIHVATVVNSTGGSISASNTNTVDTITDPHSHDSVHSPDARSHTYSHESMENPPDSDEYGMNYPMHGSTYPHQTYEDEEVTSVMTSASNRTGQSNLTTRTNTTNATMMTNSVVTGSLSQRNFKDKYGSKLSVKDITTNNTNNTNNVHTHTNELPKDTNHNYLKLDKKWGLVKNVNPNELIKQNNIRKYY